jgi:hypothetical protein
VIFSNFTKWPWGRFANARSKPVETLRGPSYLTVFCCGSKRLSAGVALRCSIKQTSIKQTSNKHQSTTNHAGRWRGSSGCPWGRPRDGRGLRRRIPGCQGVCGRGVGMWSCQDNCGHWGRDALGCPLVLGLIADRVRPELVACGVGPYPCFALNRNSGARVSHVTRASSNKRKGRNGRQCPSRRYAASDESLKGNDQ